MSEPDLKAQLDEEISSLFGDIQDDAEKGAMKCEDREIAHAQLQSILRAAGELQRALQ